MFKFLRRSLHKYVPGHFRDPLGLALRVLKTGDPAAHFAMKAAAMGVVASPLDLAARFWERQLYEKAPPATRPLIFICGPPRSGTTLVYQTLIDHLPVDYFSNLTSLFPRSPLMAQRMFGRIVGTSDGNYENFYGKTNRLAGTNDALYLWDRWFGRDRSHAPKLLLARQANAMRQFFAACEIVYERPLVNKNNSLNVSAHLVAEELGNAYFLCLTRNRQPLAESLYRARCDIHGSPDVPYGLTDPELAQPTRDDPIESVCKQVLYFERIQQSQLERIGNERFWLVRYEQFCEQPEVLLQRVATEMLGIDPAAVKPVTRQFQPSNKQRVSSEISAQIRECLATIRLAQECHVGPDSRLKVDLP